MIGISDKLQQIIDEFFTFTVETAPQVIVYCPQITERLRFTCDFIFKQGLKVNYVITDSESEFNDSSLARINYSEKELKDAVNIQPSGLLLETDLKVLKRIHHKKNNLIYFFQTPDRDFHFDVFSSVFYFVSRYEEWLPYISDKHGRFENRASLLYMLGAHRKPMVDYWVLDLKNYLLALYPKLQFPQKKFRYLSTIDVDNVYAYKAKPLSRSLGASAKDFLNLNFPSIGERIKTLYFFKKDPFDAYDLHAELSEKYNIPLIYFFLCRNDTEHDRTIDPKHPAFARLLKEITKKNIAIGVHPSYFSSSETNRFRHETELLKEYSGQSIPFSRQHYLRFDVGSTPQHLMDAGIKYDFTMGYASDIGFRAGTSLPFYYFDFEQNQTLPLLAVPFEVMDGAFYTYNAIQPKQAEKETLAIVEEIQKVNGLFITVFHDRTFGTNFFPGWKPFYLRLQERLRNTV
jgi:hypothetical protein